MAFALEMSGITRYFASSGVLANDGVNFCVETGEVHALVGENGAGKTTLMNILYGLVTPDSGEIRINGQPVIIERPDDAIKAGIGMVHQHFKLVPSFTVAQNILLGVEPSRFGFVSRKRGQALAAALAQKVGLDVDVTARTADLPVGMQQRVEILKALNREAKILILDEPTAVLTPQEVRDLIAVIRGLSAQGYTIIFITHKLPEVLAVADRVSVMRGGRMVGTREVVGTDIPELARMMVGRDVQLRVEKSDAAPGDVVFEADDVSVAGANGAVAVRHLSLQVRGGEILGVAGVTGNGQTELVEAIAGMRPLDGGSMRFMGRDVSRASVRERRRMGMAHVPEDRLKTGLNLQTSLDENLIVSRVRLPDFNRMGFLIRSAIRDFAANIVRRFSIASARPGGSISTLSGGSMQKVILGRELSGSPSFIIANQPTRGLDVGSTVSVHRTLLDARDRGVGVLLVSVALEEVMALSDRIIVLYRGQVQGELDAAIATEEAIGTLMAGGTLAQAGGGELQ